MIKLTNDRKKQLAKIFPPEFVKELAKSADNFKLGLTLVLSNEIMQQLINKQTAMIKLDDGGVILLISQETVESYYAPIPTTPNS